MAAALFLIAAPVHAVTIEFDELPARNANVEPLTTEYAALGIRFETTDDGSTFDGIGNGDPGGWGLEGTAGSVFMGFNGESYGAVARFDTAVEQVALDVAGSELSSPGDTVTLVGRMAGVDVEQVSVVIGAVNEWKTAMLVGPVDEIEWFGSSLMRFHPYGVDNLRWTPSGATPPPDPPIDPPVDPPADVLAVEIDISPKRDTNRIPIGRHEKKVKVLVFGSESLDVGELLPETIGFGPESAAPIKLRLRDANRDGFPDLLVRFRVGATGLSLDDTDACLTAETLDGTGIEGCDAVAPFEKKRRRHGEDERKHDEDERKHDEDDD